MNRLPTSTRDVIKSILSDRSKVITVLISLDMLLYGRTYDKGVSTQVAENLHEMVMNISDDIVIDATDLMDPNDEEHKAKVEQMRAKYASEEHRILMTWISTYDEKKLDQFANDFPDSTWVSSEISSIIGKGEHHKTPAKELGTTTKANDSAILSSNILCSSSEVEILRHGEEGRQQREEEEEDDDDDDEQQGQENKQENENRKGKENMKEKEETDEDEGEVEMQRQKQQPKAKATGVRPLAMTLCPRNTQGKAKTNLRSFCQ